MLKKPRTQVEFILLMAALMSIVALAIDTLLPALDVIGLAIHTTKVADNQLLIILFFLGLGLGPLIFGPLSDAIGRKPVIYIGFVFFIIASFICIYAYKPEIMIAGRIIQGVALSAPRTISIAMIRDTYYGDYMARVMSFTTVIFLLIPIIAPAIGKWILDHYSWQAIFYLQIVFSIIIWLWFWQRQPETLQREKRIPYSFKIFAKGLLELMQYKTTICYTYITGFVMGSFLVYLSTAQQIFQEQYELKEEFPYIFAGLAITIATSIFLNGSFVLKFGMEKLITIALSAFSLVSLLYFVLYYGKPNPNLYILLAFFSMQFFSLGFLFGNLRAIAMQPVGHIAGIGSAITSLISTLMSVPISIYIGRHVDETAIPIFIGFLICSALSLSILFFLKRSIKKEKNISYLK